MFILCSLTLVLRAQDDADIKPAVLAFHLSYYDFETAQQIRTTSLNDVLAGGKWNNIANMQMGLGFNYFKGITRHIDFTAALDGSYIDYLYKNGSTNGSSIFLLDGNTMLNFKLFSDKHIFAPFISAGAGFSFYKNKAGAYLPAGIGLQVNLFKEAFVFTQMQYRRALGSVVNDHFQYSIGVGIPVGRKRKKAMPLEKSHSGDTVKNTLQPVQKVIEKNVVVQVTDQQTSLPLAGVEVELNGEDGGQNTLSNAAGLAVFNAVKAADYTITGRFHDIATTGGNVLRNAFDAAGDEINIRILHNDPRFTLSGVVRNRSTGQPEGGVEVKLLNVGNGNSLSVQNKPDDGGFTFQLTPESDFTVSGKKKDYISNIAKISTRGLLRSKTLYVDLQLEVEEALPDKTITLKNIYYNTGSFKIRPDASTDLEKLVNFMKDNPELSVEVDSHTDSRGSSAFNLKLSRLRAAEVVTYLIRQGIDKHRLVAKGYGATQLVNGCKVGVKCTDAQHEQNRRTEFKVLKK